MLAALTRSNPDHIPCSPMISQGPWFAKPLYWRDQFERAERFKDLGLDPVIDIWFPDPQPHPDVKITTYRDTSGSEPLLTKEYHTPAGVLRQTIVETDDWCEPGHGFWIPTTFGVEKRTHFNMELFDDHNISRRTEPWVKGPEDIEKLRYLIRMPEGHVLDEWIMDSQRAMKMASEHDVLTTARRTIVGDAFQWFCDIENFMCWMVEAPEFVTEFLSIFQEWSLKLTELALEMGVDVVQRRGAYELSSCWGVKFWKDYLVPLIEEETSLVHQAGKLHSYFQMEGQGIYAHIYREMGVDILWALDPLTLGEGDMNSLFDALGDRKSFWGGISPEVTVQSADAVQIDKAVKEAVEVLGANGGLVLSSYLFPALPQEGIMLMIDSWRKHCLS